MTTTGVKAAGHVHGREQKESGCTIQDSLSPGNCASHRVEDKGGSSTSTNPIKTPPSPDGHALQPTGKPSSSGSSQRPLDCVQLLVKTDHHLLLQDVTSLCCLTVCSALHVAFTSASHKAPNLFSTPTEASPQICNKSYKVAFSECRLGAVQTHVSQDS